jgi:hypothetical protein
LVKKKKFHYSKFLEREWLNEDELIFNGQQAVLGVRISADFLGVAKYTIFGISGAA